jgi:hypothetical protein
MFRSSECPPIPKTRWLLLHINFRIGRECPAHYRFASYLGLTVVDEDRSKCLPPLERSN